MTVKPPAVSEPPPRRDRRTRRTLLLQGVAVAGAAPWLAHAADTRDGSVVTPQWRATAQRVAQTGVPLDALAPNAPASHTVQRGDTLWDISALFLKSPWRWPELWGMNLEQVRNPHLIYPGQVLTLVKRDGRATLQFGQGGDGGTVRLSPRVRSQLLPNGAIAAVPLERIGPFLNEAVVLDDEQSLLAAARIVAAPDQRVLIGEGDSAYVRGDLRGQRSFTVFREPRPLVDPQTRAVLGYEAAFVGTADLTRLGEDAGRDGLPVPATVKMTRVRQEAGIGDRLTGPLLNDLHDASVPRAPETPVDGRVVSIYGQALTAGQNQIVALNLGRQHGLAAGHVLHLWRDGGVVPDRTTRVGRWFGPTHEAIRLPDESNGWVFVFRTFERVSYALIVRALDPVRPGDRVTEPRGG